MSDIEKRQIIGQNTIFMPDTLRVGVFLAQGFDGPGVSKLLEVHDSFLTGSPLVYDGILIVGSGTITPHFTYSAQNFTTDIYDHFKPIGIIQNGDAVLEPLGYRMMMAS